MKVGRFTLPLTAIAAVVILGGFAVGLIANAVLASEPDPQPANFPKPSPDDKLTVVVHSDYPAPGGLGEPSAPGQPSGPGTVYTWQDGDRTQRVVLQDGLVVEDNESISPGDEVLVRGPSDSIVQKDPGGLADPLPVFRSQSGGGLMTLSGGVLVALDPEWDQAKVEDFFTQNGISLDSTTELEFIDNGFLIDTGPGFESLDLANELAAQDGVLISSPNWWREAQAK